MIRRVLGCEWRRAWGASLVALASAVFVSGGVASATSVAGTGDVAPRSVYVLLVGYPDPPGDADELSTLTKVDSDVAMMRAFFGALGPVKEFVHLPVGSQVGGEMAEQGVMVRRPTLRAIQRSVDDLMTLLVDDPAADVYVYYAGHGRSTQVDDRVRTELFLEPESEGEDGSLTSRALHDEVLERLTDDERTRVHLVVDACQSYFVLERRGPNLVRRVPKAAPPVDPKMVERFQAELPGVGALLATNGDQLAYEDARIGGVFSYAVRTAGIGSADLDRDGRVTYRELTWALPEILGQRAGGGPPGLVPPGGDYNAAFIDYRGRSVAQVEFAPEVDTRYVLLHGVSFEAYAAVYPAAGSPVMAWLPSEQGFFAAARTGEDAPAERFRFVARSSRVESIREVEPLSLRARGFSEDGGVLRRPVVASRLEQVEPPEWVWMPQGYAAVSLTGLMGASPLGQNVGSSGDSFGGGGELSLVLGLGAHQGSLRVGALRTFHTMQVPGGASLPIEADTVHAGLGYGYVLVGGSLAELSVGPFARIAESTMRDLEPVSGEQIETAATFFDAGGELSGRFFVNRSRWALRVDARAGSRTQVSRDEPGSTDLTDFVIEVGVGLEYELGVR